MYVERLYLKNYRNIAEVDLSFNPSLNLMIGSNAQGKTNILESIYLLGTGSSHRTNRSQDIISWEKDYFFIKSSIKKRQREMSISYGFNGSKKDIKIDNNPIQRISDLMGYVNVVIFSPEDLQMVKGSPSFRRHFLNLEISQVNPYYYHNLQKYNQVLQQRNLLLKEIRKNKSKRDLLFIWNQQLVDLGSRLIKKRLEVIGKLDILARLIHRKITGGRENLIIGYDSTLGKVTNEMTHEEIQEMFETRLIKEQENEILRGVTLVGPQRDDLDLLVNNINIRKFGSQGQQRTTALALKIAELEFMKSEMGEYPILLLDDVFSELDLSRKKHLLGVIRDRIQTFITSTDLDVIQEIQGKYNLFYIQNGQVIEKKESE
ncbi:MAG: DNA replication/repair protein RecF [Halanaerobiales bacterium]|nr:DNA replication/repair protein RecF [Halanaerobiales bacterium]